MVKTVLVSLLIMVVLIGTGGGVAAANPTEKAGIGVVIFETDKYQSWQWYGLAYPDDMLLEASLSGDANSGGQDSRDSLRLLAHLGTEPTGGYGIGIEKVILEGGTLTVLVHTKSPAPGQPVTMAFTHPKDTVMIDLRGVCLPRELDIRWIDQTGKLLSSRALTAPPPTYK